MLTDNPKFPLILFVEDDKNQVELARTSLQDADEEYRLELATTLSEAQSIIERHCPDLIITDYSLSDGDGSKLVAMTNSLCPVVMMTTEADVKIAVQAMKIGVHDYVVKTSAVLSGITRIVQRGLREWSHIQGCKRAENFLRESDANYRLLFDNANDAIFIIDAQKRIIEVNPPAVERFGYTYAELTSMSLDQLDPLEQGKDRIARLLEQGHPGNLRHSYG